MSSTISSTLTWLSLSETEHRRAVDVIAVFREKDGCRSSGCIFGVTPLLES